MEATGFDLATIQQLCAMLDEVTSPLRCRPGSPTGYRPRPRGAALSL